MKELLDRLVDTGRPALTVSGTIRLAEGPKWSPSVYFRFLTVGAPGAAASSSFLCHDVFAVVKSVFLP